MKMVCSECDHIERDPIFLDVETCSMCGANLEAMDDFDGDEYFDPENIYNLPGIRQSIEEDRKR